MPPFRRKRRTPHGPSKSELRASRAEYVQLKRAQTGSLRLNHPHVKALTLDLRLHARSDATLDAIRRTVGLDEPLFLNVPCPGGCNGGVFLLTAVIEELLQARREEGEGVSVCQAAFYADPQAACGTKLIYRVTVQYAE